MPQWTEEKPLQVATGFTYLGPKFMKENGLNHVSFSTADGALEAAPAMWIADAILDLLCCEARQFLAEGQFTVTANMRGSSAEEVAERVLSQPSLSCLQGPTISPVFLQTGVLVSSLTYIFYEETPRWRELLSALGLQFSLCGRCCARFVIFL
ncbi:hypothetical protein L3X38_041006 [Prunus dulcis]|uniref:ATP phosphoribosyltransferase n=1 Tax=Prunus dulcis TaxID=3755 RepID=A0AAD4UT81_PRUDU|nr:hypothetical protein L3X38_041006 [Prunus dulcis]